MSELGVKIGLKKADPLVLSLTLLSSGFKYKKSGGTKTYKILKLQNKIKTSIKS
jgi:hypothetical protein